jgi:hypothetical protein
MHVSSVTVRITEGCRKHRNGLAVTLSMFEYLVFEYVYVRILGIRMFEYLVFVCSNTWYSHVRMFYDYTSPLQKYIMPSAFSEEYIC